MKSPVLVPIVEGYSEVSSVPVLFRRLLRERGFYHIKVESPIRIPRYKIVRPGELERAFELARRRPEGCDAVLILLDAEDDCPKELAPSLLERGRRANADIPSRVVLAKHEFENWFLGSLESLRGKRGLSESAVPPNDPEEVRDAKGYLRHQMVERRTYVQVDDQPALADLFDMQLARSRCPSFDKFIRDLDTLLASL